MKPNSLGRLILATTLLASLPLALTAQDGADKPKTDGGTSKVIASVNADVLAARKANAEHRYGDAQSLMLKDLADHPGMVILRVELALAEMGMEKYDDAALNFKSGTSDGYHRPSFRLNISTVRLVRRRQVLLTRSKRKIHFHRCSRPDWRQTPCAGLDDNGLQTGMKLQDCVRDGSESLHSPNSRFAQRLKPRRFWRTLRTG